MGLTVNDSSTTPFNKSRTTVQKDSMKISDTSQLVEDLLAGEELEIDKTKVNESREEENQTLVDNLRISQDLISEQQQE